VEADRVGPDHLRCWPRAFLHRCECKADDDDDDMLTPTGYPSPPPPPPTQQPTRPAVHTAHSRHCGHTALPPRLKANPYPQMGELARRLVPRIFLHRCECKAILEKYVLSSNLCEQSRTLSRMAQFVTFEYCSVCFAFERIAGKPEIASVFTVLAARFYTDVSARPMMMMMFTLERHPPTPGQHGHSPQRHGRAEG